MNKNKLSTNAVEDWYGTCAVALCKAALTYNPDRNVKFSVLAYVCMSNEMKMVFRQQEKEIKIQYSLDEEENNSFQNRICSRNDEIGEIEFYTVFNKYYSKLNETHKNIINDKIYTDITQKELCSKYNLSQGYISKIYNKFLDNIYSDLYGKRG
jgi:RNA polymerase sigma factor (sigma-70 family)